MPHLSWNEVRDRALRFSREHSGDRSESAEKQTFWNDFFNVFGLRRASVASFEENVRNLRGNTSSIDLLWKGRLLVEHKSFGADLSLAETQAFTYIEDLTRENRWDEIPRYVLVSDFARFVLYDLEPDEQRDLPLFAGRHIAPHHFTLAEFHRSIRHFAFMLGQARVRVDPEDPANEKAYQRMCELHDALKAGGFDVHDLERLLVRILFCLFAEDSGLFAPDAFTQFVRTRTSTDGADLGQHLSHLFEVLDTPFDGRQQELDEDLAAFPYVNGLLFRERLRTPIFTRAMRDALLFCCDFQWAKISPAVFGSLFQGVLDGRVRRQQGAHYTSERDIMKVLRSLFLDGLRNDLKHLLADRSTRRRAGLEAFHERLRSLRFLDPACGCGNFLVLAYRELRALEVDVLKEITMDGVQRVLDVRQLLKIDVDQFHGIESGEWPVRIAEVALWLMDHQMNQHAAEAFGQSFDRLPLRSAPHIVHDNALRADWTLVLPPSVCTYLLGNPPFVGAKFQTAEQRADMELVAGKLEAYGLLDYVCGWYLKAAVYIQNTQIVVGFVSTNSITQGEQVSVLWRPMLDRFHICIHFAHRTFAWMSEARGKAHVHVVIVGFASFSGGTKEIYDYEDESHPTVTIATNINPYLTDGPNVTIANREAPLCDVPSLRIGNKPIDGGFYLFTPEEMQEFVREEPASLPYFRRWLGSVEMINGIERWCLWLGDVAPSALRQLPNARRRVEMVAQFRRGEIPGKGKEDTERNKRRNEMTQKLAATPRRFHVENIPSEPFLAIPKVSSERRPYIPIAFVGPDTLASDLLFVLRNANHWHFGILTSAIHVAWVRAIAGRLKSDFRYSATLVYNNFPWPTATPQQQAAVQEKARAVLNVRERYLPPRGMNNLADLYDVVAMPTDLLEAHSALDRAVDRCYRDEPLRSDRERVEHLLQRYERLAVPLLPVTPSRRRVRHQPVKRLPRSSRTAQLFDVAPNEAASPPEH